MNRHRPLASIGLATVLAAIPLHATERASEFDTGWVERAGTNHKLVSVVQGIRRPELLAYTDSYVYGPNSTFGSEVTFKVTINPNNYTAAVSLYLFWQNRVTQEKRYYNVSGGFSTTEVDLFGAAGSPHAEFVPTLSDFELFGPNGAFGPLAGVPTTTGQYQLVLEVRTADGAQIVGFTNAMYSFVDALVNKVGNINSSETWTANNVYYLGAPVFVGGGATLTIEPGTFVLGSTGGQGLLGVLQGAKVNAQGSELRPIVFSSEQRRDDRAIGDWGGVAINGRAPINADNAVGEGDTGPYGGSDPNDNSGVLSYVRIEWPGIRFSDQNELNGLALQGVGAGTKLDHIQTIQTQDDGIEFFGGTANISEAIVVQAQDDQFDWTFGWTGSATNVCLIQNFGEADKGIEADNQEEDNQATPRSLPTLTNLLIHMNSSVGAGASTDEAVLLRRGTGARISNMAIVNVPGDKVGVNIDGDVTNGLIGTADLTFAGVIEDGAGTATNVAGGLSGVCEGAANIANPGSAIQPDPQPRSGSAGCTTRSNDWTKAYWISWDIGRIN